MTKAKKIDPPWASETVAAKKSSTPARKTKDKSLQMTLFTNGQQLELSFSTARELEIAKITVSTRCGRGAVATIVASGKEYLFVPNLGYIITDVAE